MNIRYLSMDYAVAPQITPADVAALKEEGIATLVCNRPDGEGADQASFAAIDAQARAVGIRTVYLPVVPGKITDADRAAFATLYARAPKPMLGYCRTGLRAETLWNDTRDQRPDDAAPTTDAGQ